ncbi:thioredoxin TrxA [Jimgerdemannia flammicorona]|uniref:Thioredoxin TrxA n=1 Tax=Jimgerdemannia flammicorona TaxID=994334 RepID=A0A433DLX2_9FUNG|nr:thioredoxin TrxA [Jimgerdemannia flammicorona]
MASLATARAGWLAARSNAVIGYDKSFTFPKPTTKQLNMPLQRPVNLDEFNELINGDKLVVVDFFATWCGPCQVISPKFEGFSNEEDYSNVIFVKIDVDEVQDVSEAMNIRAMPTFLAFRNGQRLGEVVGANVAKLQDLIKSNL